MLVALPLFIQRFNQNGHRVTFEAAKNFFFQLRLDKHAMDVVSPAAPATSFSRFIAKFKGPLKLSDASEDPLWQALEDALKDGAMQRMEGQNSLDQNLEILKKIKDEVRDMCKEGPKLSPSLMLRRVQEELDLGIIVNVASLAFTGPVAGLPGTFANKSANAISKAANARDTGLKKEFEIRLALLIRYTKAELEKLHPLNKKFCIGLQDLIQKEIDRFSPDIKEDSPLIQQVEGMLEWHQRVLSINHYHPLKVEVDKDLFDISLSEIPYEIPGSSASNTAGIASTSEDSAEGKLRLKQNAVHLAYRQFIRNTEAGSDITRKRVMLLFYGPGGTGKSFESRRSGFKVFDQGAYTAEIMPVHYSLDGLVKLPDTAEKKKPPPRPYYYAAPPPPSP